VSWRPESERGSRAVIGYFDSPEKGLKRVDTRDVHPSPLRLSRGYVPSFNPFRLSSLVIADQPRDADIELIDHCLKGVSWTTGGTWWFVGTAFRSQVFLTGSSGPLVAGRFSLPDGFTKLPAMT
jgi:hypothetical protein